MDELSGHRDRHLKPLASWLLQNQQGTAHPGLQEWTLHGKWATPSWGGIPCCQDAPESPLYPQPQAAASHIKPDQPASPPCLSPTWGEHHNLSMLTLSLGRGLHSKPSEEGAPPRSWLQTELGPPSQAAPSSDSVCNMI